MNYNFIKLLKMSLYTSYFNISNESKDVPIKAGAKLTTEMAPVARRLLLRPISVTNGTLIILDDGVDIYGMGARRSWSEIFFSAWWRHYMDTNFTWPLCEDYTCWVPGKKGPVVQSGFFFKN